MKPNDLVNMLGAMDGAEIPGGCDECDAVQKVRAIKAGIWDIEVIHEDNCPAMARTK
jgi:hypothetical protein